MFAPSYRQLQARCICSVSDRQTTSRYTISNCTASICSKSHIHLFFSWLEFLLYWVLHLLYLPVVYVANFFLHLWRCGERVEKQRSDLQIQRHSSQDINLTDSNLHCLTCHASAVSYCNTNSGTTFDYTCDVIWSCPPTVQFCLLLWLEILAWVL